MHMLLALYAMNVRNALHRNSLLLRCWIFSVGDNGCGNKSPCLPSHFTAHNKQKKSKLAQKVLVFTHFFIHLWFCPICACVRRILAELSFMLFSLLTDLQFVMARLLAPAQKCHSGRHICIITIIVGALVFMLSSEMCIFVMFWSCLTVYTTIICAFGLPSITFVVTFCSFESWCCVHLH